MLPIRFAQASLPSSPSPSTTTIRSYSRTFSSSETCSVLKNERFCEFLINLVTLICYSVPIILELLFLGPNITYLLKRRRWYQAPAEFAANKLNYPLILLTPHYIKPQPLQFAHGNLTIYHLLIHSKNLHCDAFATDTNHIYFLSLHDHRPPDFFILSLVGFICIRWLLLLLGRAVLALRTSAPCLQWRDFGLFLFTYFSSCVFTLCLLGTEIRDCIQWWVFGHSPMFVFTWQRFFWVVNGFGLLCILGLHAMVVQSNRTKVFTLPLSSAIKPIKSLTLIFFTGSAFVAAVTVLSLGIWKMWNCVIWGGCAILLLEHIFRQWAFTRLRGYPPQPTDSLEEEEAVERTTVRTTVLNMTTHPPAAPFSLSLASPVDALFPPLNLLAANDAITSTARDLCRKEFVQLPNSYIYVSEEHEMEVGSMSGAFSPHISAPSTVPRMIEGNKNQEESLTSSPSFVSSDDKPETSISFTLDAACSLCIVCLEHSTRIIFEPCGHGVLCLVCVSQLFQQIRENAVSAPQEMINGSIRVVCPLCRAAVKDVYQIISDDNLWRKRLSRRSTVPDNSTALVGSHVDFQSHVVKTMRVWKRPPESYVSPTIL